jgi:hypothetical protein
MKKYDIWYEIYLGVSESWGKVINEIEVARETKEYLILSGGSKVKKTHSPSGYDPFVYKPTKQEAIEFAENYFNNELKEALKRVETIKERLAQIQKEKENENNKDGKMWKIMEEKRKELKQKE